MKMYAVTLNDKGVNNLETTLASLREQGMKQSHVFKNLGVVVGSCEDPKKLRKVREVINVEEETNLF